MSLWGRAVFSRPWGPVLCSVLLWDRNPQTLSSTALGARQNAQRCQKTWHKALGTWDPNRDNKV